MFDSFSVGIDFTLQNLTSPDVRFGCLKSVPALKGFKSKQLVMFTYILHEMALKSPVKIADV